MSLSKQQWASSGRRFAVDANSEEVCVQAGTLCVSAFKSEMVQTHNTQVHVHYEPSIRKKTHQIRMNLLNAECS